MASRISNLFINVKVAMFQSNNDLENSALIGNILWISIQDIDEKTKFEEVKEIYFFVCHLINL